MVVAVSPRQLAEAVAAFKVGPAGGARLTGIERGPADQR